LGCWPGSIRIRCIRVQFAANLMQRHLCANYILTTALSLASDIYIQIVNINAGSGAIYVESYAADWASWMNNSHGGLALGKCIRRFLVTSHKERICVQRPRCGIIQRRGRADESTIKRCNLDGKAATGLKFKLHTARSWILNAACRIYSAPFKSERML